MVPKAHAPQCAAVDRITTHVRGEGSAADVVGAGLLTASGLVNGRAAEFAKRHVPGRGQPAGGRGHTYTRLQLTQPGVRRPASARAQLGARARPLDAGVRVTGPR